jgi:hypothetical protein
VSLRLGIADHYAYANIVVASTDHDVVDRRRIALVEPGAPECPVHGEGKGLDDAACRALVDEFRDSIWRCANAAFDDLPKGIASVFLRSWPLDFPTDLATQRKLPYENWADSIIYRQVIADAAEARGWTIHLYDPKSVEAEARVVLGTRADDVIDGPRQRLGAPWAKDHRMALSATIVGG